MAILRHGGRRVNPGRPPDGPSAPRNHAPGGRDDLARRLADDAADRARGGDVECDPADWPDWTDLHFYETAADDPPDGHDRLAAESAALDALERGLIPPDVADHVARTSIAGHDA